MADGQLSRDDLRRLTPEQIAQANREGRLAVLLTGRPPADVGSREWFAQAKPEAIVAAHRAGLLAAAAANGAKPMPVGDAAPAAPGPPRPTGSADQGSRGTKGTKFATREWLQSASPEAIVAAHRDGLLDPLINGQR